jgi:hypothetical protein
MPDNVLLWSSLGENLPLGLSSERENRSGASTWESGEVSVSGGRTLVYPAAVRRSSGQNGAYR